MECTHLNNGCCKLAESLVQIECTVDNSVCLACKRSSKPMALNQIVAIHATSKCIEEGIPTPPEVKQASLLGVPTGGPGSILAGMISWFVRKPPDCDCDDRVDLMNLWGPDKCKQEKRTILQWLRESALDNNVRHSEFMISFMIDASINISRLTSILGTNRLKDDTSSLTPEIESTNESMNFHSLLPLLHPVKGQHFLNFEEPEVKEKIESNANNWHVEPPEISSNVSCHDDTDSDRQAESSQGMDSPNPDFDATSTMPDGL